jgi:hypothetical protein
LHAISASLESISSTEIAFIVNVFLFLLVISVSFYPVRPITPLSRPCPITASPFGGVFPISANYWLKVISYL